MAGEVKMKDVKQRNPKEQKKKRKDGGPSDKHKFSLAEQMDDTKEAPPRNRSAKARKMQEEEEVFIFSFNISLGLPNGPINWDCRSVVEEVNKRHELRA